MYRGRLPPPKALTAIFFALDSEFTSCHQHINRNRRAGARVERAQARQGSNLALRSLYYLRREPKTAFY